MSVRLAALALGTIIILCLVPLPFELFGDVGERVSDAAHVPLAFVVLILINQLISRSSSRSTAATLLIAAGSTAVGAFVVEEVQPYFGRSKSIEDFTNGIIGVLLGSIFLVLVRRRRSITAWACASGLAVLLSGYALLPAWQAYQLRAFQIQLFPTLADFREPRAAALFRPTGNGAVPETITFSPLPEGTGSMTVSPVPGVFSGVIYRGNGLNWESSGNLVIVFSSTESVPRELHIRVDDYKDCSDFDARFNRAITIFPGKTVITIPVAEIRHGPKNRPLHLAHVRRMLIFAPPEDRPRPFTITGMALLSTTDGR